MSNAVLQLFDRLHQHWALHQGSTLACWWAWMVLLRRTDKAAKQVTQRHQPPKAIPADLFVIDASSSRHMLPEQVGWFWTHGLLFSLLLRYFL